MSQSQVKLIVLIMAICCSLLSCVKNIEEAPTKTISAEEYSVYNALIEDILSRAKPDMLKLFKLCVIIDHTSAEFLEDISFADVKEIFELREEEVPEALSLEIIADFQNKNREEYPLERNFQIQVEYIFISKEEESKIFSDRKDGWNNFYKQYPNSQGIMTFSRVGFNKEMNQALVYFGNQSNWLAGMGFYLLFTKKDGKWAFQREFLIWIS